MTEKQSLDFRSFQLERYMAKYEFTMNYPFSCSDPTSYTIDEIFNLTSDPLECYKNLGQVNLCYTETQGDPELRQLISQYIYDNKIESNKIIVHSGAAEAIFTFFTSFLKANDDVIVLSPCYQSLYEIPRACGCNVSEWNLIDYDGKWQIDLVALQKLITPQTKLIIINTPHNPTGFHINEEEQKYIIQLAKQNGIYIFADEVYRYTEQNPNHILQSFCVLYDKAIALGVTSKSMSLAGLRIGWICSQNQEILDKISKQKDYTTICNSAPSEFIAKIAIQNSNQIFKRNIIIFQTQLQLINNFIHEFNSYLQWNSPTSCTIGFAKIIWNNFPNRLRSQQGKPSDIFCKDILEKAGILLIPGTQFDFLQTGRYDNYFRMSFCRVNTQEILVVFKIYMEQWILNIQDQQQI